MKIIFLCGCLEPGCDGVGDYTRILAAALRKKGLYTAIIGLNDYFIGSSRKEEQIVGTISIPVLRLKEANLDRKTIKEARDYVEDLAPDWISLQYVPYSFQKKGVPWRIGQKISVIGAGIKWHIMFHELWIGIAENAALKQRIIGLLQKRIANNLARQPNIKSICTSNALYKNILQDAGIEARLLPLFSNIPVAATDLKVQEEILNKLSIHKADRDSFLLCGLFGTLHPDAYLELILANLLMEAQRKDKSLVFIAIGRTGDKGISELKRLQKTFVEINFFILGSQNEKNVSNILQMLDVAISGTPGDHLGKSGVFAILKLHDLRIEIGNKYALPHYSKSLDAEIDVLIQSPPHQWHVKKVADEFIGLLQLNDESPNNQETA
jgi:hypothetical protein